MKGEGTYSGSGHLVIVNVPSYEEIKELIRELDLSPDFREVPCVIVAASLPGEDRELPAFLAAQVDGFVRGLPSSMETLERADVSRARACLLMSSASDPGMDDTNTLTAGLIEKNWPRVLTIMACSRGETMKNLGLFNIDGGISATDLQMGLLVQELEDPGVFEVYSQLSSNAEGSQIYISRTPLGKWNFDPGELTLGQLKLAALRLDLPADILGIKRKSEKNILLNPPNHLTLTATDRLVYMAEERFDWLQRSPEILQQIGKNS